MSHLGHDLRYAARTLLRAPTFALTVIATLSLGIGANAVVFSAVDAVLLHDVPVSDSGRLVDVYTSSNANPYGNSSYPDYFDLRDSGTFASLAAFAPVTMTIEAMGQTERIDAQLVSGNYFDVLGVRFPVGRGFMPEEDRIGMPVPVAVVSHALWRRLFNTDPTLVGRAVRLNSSSYTVVGVAPSGFGGSLLGTAADVWVPTALQPEVDPASAALRRSRGHAGKFDLRASRGVNMVGRLPAGVPLAETATRAEVVSQRLQATYADTNRNRRFVLAPLGEGRGLRTTTRPVLRLLTVVVLLVLAVACVNVASLTLVHGMAREREVAVRHAIGASRARLVRQWLTESALLGTLGSAGALIVAHIGTPLLHRFVIPEAVDLSMNPRVLGFTLVAGAATGLFFGIAPAVQTLQRSTVRPLRERGSTGGTRGSGWLRSTFVVLQIAISLMLVVGAGLFLRTLTNAYAVDLGYRINDTIVTSITLDARRYAPDAGLAAYEQILSRLNALPGVAAASAARMTVLSGTARSVAVSTNGRPIERDLSNALGVRENIVSARYFETMGIPILHGRAFDVSDASSAPRVAIVTQSLADRLWPHRDPIGQTLRDESAQVLTVVGVVPDTIYATTLEVQRPPTYYVPLAQDYQSGVTLHVRAARDPMSLVPAVREAVRAVDSQLAIEQPQLLLDVLNRTLSHQRMLATLVGLFGAITLILAVTGLYGVMARVATERTPELGVRLAMGAQPASIVMLLLTQGLRLLASGLAMGLLGAAIGTRFIQSQLFGVTATDALTFAGGSALLAVTCVVASAIPAIRAMRIDPVEILRRT